MKQPATQERLGKLALTYIDMPPRSFGRFVKTESALWGGVIKAVGISAE